MTSALVFLDESGDLGWKLDAPYRQGGSSRYFTIAVAIGGQNHHRKFGQLMRDVHHFNGWTSKQEKKWTDTKHKARLDFGQRVVKLCQKQLAIKLVVTTIEKAKVPPHMREGHFHLLYAWMVATAIAPIVKQYSLISVCPDDLNNGCTSDGLLENMLRHELWFKLQGTSTVQRVPKVAASAGGLSFCDFLAGAVQSHLEDGESTAFNALKDSIQWLPLAP